MLMLMVLMVARLGVSLARCVVLSIGRRLKQRPVSNTMFSSRVRLRVLVLLLLLMAVVVVVA